MPSPAPPQPRVIKKYPNRRLYDTSASAYITLPEIRQLVIDQQAFEVIDAKTDANLTRSILLQIILEAEAGGAPLFTAPVLASLIRFYGHAMQGFLGGYLEKNIQMLMDIQTQLAEKTGVLTPDMWTHYLTLQAPMMQAMLGGTLDQSKAMLTVMQEQMQRQADQMLDAFGIRHKP